MSRVLLILLCLAIIPLTGCGPRLKDKAYKVSGTVKFADGQPVTKGAINFENSKYNAYGLIGPDGAFTLTTLHPGDGAPAGSYKISFSGDLVGAGSNASPPQIATKYASAATSDLTHEVKAEVNVIDVKVDRYTAPPPPKK